MGLELLEVITVKEYFYRFCFVNSPKDLAEESNCICLSVDDD